MANQSSSSIEQSQDPQNRSNVRRTTSGGPSGYNIFCRDISAEQGIRTLSNGHRFAAYSTRWRELSAAERKHYKELAAASTLSAEERKRKWMKGVKKMLKIMNNLQALQPTDGFFVVVPEEGSTQHGGTPEGRRFVADNYGEVVGEFVKGLSCNGHTSDKEKIGVKDIRALFNIKYCDTLGYKKKVPYKHLDNIRMEGLPDDIELKNPAMYGSAQLRKVWQARDKLKCIVSSSSTPV